MSTKNVKNGTVAPNCFSVAKTYESDGYGTVYEFTQNEKFQAAFDATTDQYYLRWSFANTKGGNIIITVNETI